MADLNLTIACGPYDRMEALHRGEVRPEGIDATYVPIQSPPEIFARMIKGGAFDYAALKKEPADLETYLAQLQSVTADELATWNDKQRFAFWINVYNAHTIEKIVENYPLDSIKDLNRAFGLDSVFDDGFIEMAAHHPSGKNKKL